MFHLVNLQVGDTIEVGQVIAKIDDGSENKDGKENKKEKMSEEETAGVVGEIEVSDEVIENSNESSYENKKNDRKVLATPVARKLAKDLDIDINNVKGSGPQGRVMKEDIYKAKEELDKGSNKEEFKNTIVDNPQIEVPDIKVSGEVERVPVSMLRKTVAKNMVLSKSIIPHASTMDDFDVTKLVEFRSNNKEMANSKGIHLTYMPFIVKAVAIALKKYPIFNSSYDNKNEEIILKKYYNIGIAADTPDGLMVPVLKNADKKGIFELAKQLDELKEKANNKNIQIEDLQDGTFTITNYGAGGTKYGIPVIKYPEVAILGVGKIEKSPIVIDNEIVIRDILPISLCIDHRVIDGGDAGRFLMRLKELLNNPILLLLN